MPNLLNRSVRGKSRSRDEKKADESVDQFNKWSKNFDRPLFIKTLFWICCHSESWKLLWIHNFNNYIPILTCSNVLRSLSVNKFYQELAYLYSRLIMLQLSVVTYTQYTSDKDRKTLQKYQHGVSTIKNTFAYIPRDTAGKTCDHIL